MFPIKHSLNRKEFFKLRERKCKTKALGKLESKIAEFLSKNQIEYHRQWPIKIGRVKKQKRYVVSFYLPEKRLVLDMTAGESDIILYEPSRRKTLIWCYKSLDKAINAIIPIDENLGWREVKKQLRVLVG